MADLDADYWTMADIADYLGVQLKTVHTYRHRGAKGEAGGLPAEDKMMGRTPVWKPERIIRWNKDRPGQGAGGGRPRKETGDERA